VPPLQAPGPAVERVPALDPAAVRDTIARVFAQADYDRSLRETLLSRLWGWLGELLRAVGRAVDRAPRPVYWAVIVLLVGVAVLVVARVAYGAYLRREQRGTAPGAGRRAGAALGRDAWLRAQERASRGEYTDAAHALYEALLDALAVRDRVRLHPSKTVGDYARDLRRRSSARLAGFREFARSYEAVVYGGVPCDRARFERLQALAAPVVGRDG
jgi:hypothetical protein